MTVKSVSINNILSFENFYIDELLDISCVVGKNNVGKSNFLKAIRYFYNRLNGAEVLPLSLNSNYDYKGSISITYDTTRLFRIAQKQQGNTYFNFIMRKLVPASRRSPLSLLQFDKENTFYTLTLYVYSNGGIKWSTSDRETLNLISYLFPFFQIEPRHMDLYEWDDLWDLISRVKSFNLSKLRNDDIIEFFNKSISNEDQNSFKDYVSDLNQIMSTKPSSQKGKILNYLKSSLDGYQFSIDDNDLKYHSDGTNSFHFIKLFLKIVVIVSRREYITPFVFIDEPEIGLHPKMNELLIQDLYENYRYENSLSANIIRPRILMATHSPSIVKEVIKSFRGKHKIFYFHKNKKYKTEVKLLNSDYNDENFVNVFSDNEARLFFSEYILFVEGETELEVFGNARLMSLFPHLRKVDIYKCSSNTIGERINPSYSNSAIPYLFLFDADKAISIQGSAKKGYYIKLKKNGDYFNFSTEVLKAEYNKYKNGFGDENVRAKDNTKYLLDINGKKLDIDIAMQQFKKSTDFESIFKNVKTRLLRCNVYLNRTTLEGCLIQNKSAEILYAWLKSEWGIDVSPLLNRIHRCRYITESVFVDYLRIKFNGKSSILSNAKMVNKSDNRAAKLLSFFEKEIELSKRFSKTDGWTTNFLNYAINYILAEAEKDDINVDIKFKLYFPEFYDILIRLRLDSKGELIVANHLRT